MRAIVLRVSCLRERLAKGYQDFNISSNFSTGQKNKYLGFNGRSLQKNLNKRFITLLFSKSRMFIVKKFIELLILFMELVLRPFLKLKSRKRQTRLIEIQEFGPFLPIHSIKCFQCLSQDCKVEEQMLLRRASETSWENPSPWQTRLRQAMPPSEKDVLQGGSLINENQE